MSILAESVQVVVGVDTHKATHTAAVVSVVSGSVLGHLSVPADRGGFGRLVAWADRFGSRRVWAVEGSAGIGRHVAQRLVADGETVVDVPAKRSARVRVLDTGEAGAESGMIVLSI